MSALKRRLERLEHGSGDDAKVVIIAGCPLPDDRGEQRSYINHALAEGRATRRRIPGGFCVYVRGHARPLTSEECGPSAFTGTRTRFGSG